MQGSIIVHWAPCKEKRGCASPDDAGHTVILTMAICDLGASSPCTMLYLYLTPSMILQQSLDMFIWGFSNLSLQQALTTTKAGGIGCRDGDTP